MAVTSDAVSAVQGVALAQAGTLAPFDITIGASANYVRVYLAGVSYNTPVVTSITVGGLAMTLVGNTAFANNFDGNYTGLCEIWERKAPGSGTKAVSVVFGDWFRGAVVARSYNGVDQTTPSDTPVTSDVLTLVGAAYILEANVSSAVGDLVGDCASRDHIPDDITAGSGQTTVMNQRDTYSYGGGASEEPGSATVNMSWIVPALFPVVMIASNMNAATAGGATAITLTGPSSGTVNIASTVFTAGANGTITGTVVVTPTSSAGTGSFNPATVNLTSGSPTATFTYTPTSAGARNINATNDGGLSAPANVPYTANAATGGGKFGRNSLSGGIL